MILHVEDRFTGEKTSITIHYMEDFYDLIMAYPDIRGVVFNSTSVNDAVEKVGEYLASRNLNVSLEGENVFEQNKVISKALTTLGVLTILATPSCLHKADNSIDVVKYRPYGFKAEDRFLQAIMQLESSGGKNLNHTDKDTIGRWGLRIPTIRDIVRRFDPHNADFAAIQSVDPENLKKLFKSRPELELHVARLLAKHLIGRFGDDVHRAAFAWRYGHNLSKEDITLEKLEKEPYVKKFHDIIQAGGLRKSEGDFTSTFKSWIEKRKRKAVENFVPSEPDYSMPRDDDKSPHEGQLARLKDAIDKAKGRV